MDRCNCPSCQMAIKKYNAWRYHQLARVFNNDGGAVWPMQLRPFFPNVLKSERVFGEPVKMKPVIQHTSVNPNTPTMGSLADSFKTLMKSFQGVNGNLFMNVAQQTTKKEKAMPDQRLGREEFEFTTGHVDMFSETLAKRDLAQDDGDVIFYQYPVMEWVKEAIPLTKKQEHIIAVAKKQGASMPSFPPKFKDVLKETGTFTLKIVVREGLVKKAVILGVTSLLKEVSTVEDIDQTAVYKAISKTLQLVKLTKAAEWGIRNGPVTVKAVKFKV